MIRRIDSTTFQAKIQSKVKHTTQSCNIKRGLKAASIYTLSTLAAYGILSACSSDKKTAAQAEPLVITTEQVAVPEPPKSKLAPNGYYIVKEGDNIWNMSKALLEEEKGTENVTDTDIEKLKKSIMRMNKLNYPSDTCGVVMIHPEDTIWVDPKAYISNKIKNSDIKEYVDMIGTALINSVPHQ